VGRRDPSPGTDAGPRPPPTLESEDGGRDRTGRPSSHAQPSDERRGGDPGYQLSRGLRAAGTVPVTAPVTAVGRIVVVTLRWRPKNEPRELDDSCPTAMASPAATNERVGVAGRTGWRRRRCEAQRRGAAEARSGRKRDGVVEAALPTRQTRHGFTASSATRRTCGTAGARPARETTAVVAVSTMRMHTPGRSRA
jgi:hypothetical protein